MGIPYFEVKDLCKKQKVTLFSSNHALYRDISLRVMCALKAEFDTCEVYSIDEAFFEIEKEVTTEEIARIRARIIQKTGIPVSFGVAKTKTLAKVANSIAKKGTGVCILNERLWKETNENLSCGSVWGIGRETFASLSRHKIYMVADLLRQDKAFISKLLGIVGERLLLELNGTSVYRIGDLLENDQKSYMSTRSFSQTIQGDKLTLMSAIGHHVAHVAEKLRNNEQVASRMTVIARGSRFGAFAQREGSVSTVFTIPTNDTFLLTREASKLLDNHYDPEIPYKKAGIVVSGIEPCSNTTPSLFDDGVINARNNKLNIVTDALNHRFGSGTIGTGVLLGSKKWKSNKMLISKLYTTKWSEIPIIKAR